MPIKLTEMFKLSMNVYRTKNFIVCQDVTIKPESVRFNTLCSFDIYVARTKTRDKEYEKFFEDRDFINGKRLHTGMYQRKYIK